MFELPPPEKVKMKDRLNDAIRMAKEMNPAAKLVRITGLALNADGTIMLGEQGKFIPRWEYAFMDDKNGEAPPVFMTVLYMAPKAPLKTPNAGNVSDTGIIPDEQVQMLADSDIVATVFNSIPGNKPCGGYDNDCISYIIQDELPTVIVMNWKGQSARFDPFTLETITGFRKKRPCPKDE